jgi:RHH-type rel operon transcriptional repressor/antitoxin RelB
MAVSVRLEPLLEKELELTAKRLGLTKSQFIISALERALGRKNPYDLLLKVQADLREPVPEGSAYLSPTKAAIRSKLRAKHEASQADWLAYQEAKKTGQTWSIPDPETGTP